MIAVRVRVRIRIGKAPRRRLPRSPLRQLDPERAIEAAYIPARQRAAHATRSAQTVALSAVELTSTDATRPRTGRLTKPVSACSQPTKAGSSPSVTGARSPFEPMLRAASSPPSPVRVIAAPR